MTGRPGAAQLVATAGGRTVRPALVLTVLGAAFFMSVLDVTSVIAALPSIAADLELTAGGAAWVVTAHGVAVGGCLLSAGRAADVVGARRMFVAATSAFAAASALCALSATGELLIAARAFQGIAAAVLTPSALSLLLAVHPEEPGRNRAIGVWGGLGAVGATAGLLIGGLLTTIVEWSWIFWINVPVCVAVVAVSRSVLPDLGRSRERSLQLPAALALSGALAAVILALLRGPEDGWTSPVVLVAGAASVMLAAGFWSVERRAVDPVLPARLWRARGMVSGNATVLLAGVAVDALLYLSTRNAQENLGLSALGFGGLAAIMTVTSVAGVIAGQALTGRLGTRSVAVAGMAIIAVGSLVLALASGDGIFLPALGLGLFGPGLGLAFTAGQIACLAGVTGEDAGTASGLEETSFAIGNTLGTTVGASAALGLGTFASATSDRTADAYFVVAVIGLAGAAAASMLPRHIDSGRSGDQPCSDPVSS